MSNIKKTFRGSKKRKHLDNDKQMIYQFHIENLRKRKVNCLQRGRIRSRSIHDLTPLKDLRMRETDYLWGNNARNFVGVGRAKTE